MTKPKPARWFATTERRADSAVVGTYQLSKSGEAKVELLEYWPGQEETGLRTYPIIHGEIASGAVTLVDTTTVQAPAWGGRTGVAWTLRPEVALEGLWLSEDDLRFTKARVAFLDQDAWTDWSIEEAGAQPWWMRPAAQIQTPEPITANVGQAQVVLRDATSLVGGRERWSAKARSAFVLSFAQPVSLTELRNEWLYPLELLVVSATGTLSGIRSLRLTNDDWGLPADTHQSARWAMARIGQPPRPKRVARKLDLLHRLGDFDLARQLPMVYQAASAHQYAIQHYAASLRPNRSGALARFMGSAQMVEALHRDLHNSEPSDQDQMVAQRVEELLTGEIAAHYLRRIKSGVTRMHEPALARRLSELDRESGRVATKLVGNGTWKPYIETLRNVVAHGPSSASALASDTGPAQVAEAILTVLFEARLLVAFGFPAAKAAEMVRRRTTYWQTEAWVRQHYRRLADAVPYP